MARSRGDLGVLALEGARTPWWRALGQGDAPIVMATTPVFGSADLKPEALIIARPSTDVENLERRLFCGRTRSNVANHPAILACIADGDAFEVLAWGDAAEKLESAGRNLAADLDAVHVVGYTASPVRL